MELHCAIAECEKLLNIDKQREAIEAFIKGQDVFVCLPTGYGKSVIYGSLPIIYDLYKGMVIN